MLLKDKVRKNHKVKFVQLLVISETKTAKGQDLLQKLKKIAEELAREIPRCGSVNDFYLGLQSQLQEDLDLPVLTKGNGFGSCIDSFGGKQIVALLKEVSFGQGHKYEASWISVKVAGERYDICIDSLKES